MNLVFKNLAWLIVALGLPAHLVGQENPENGDVNSFALLVGVGKYPNLGMSEQLDGCVNDVMLMKELLTARLHFPAENIVTLIDEQATGDNIRQAFRALAAKVRQLPRTDSSARVVIHFSGHGSQVADQPDGAHRDESDDGLDETWVPYDATRQGGEQDIRDDELNTLIGHICQEARTQMLIVADCCHSGTGMRGATKTRQLRREIVRTNSEASFVTKHMPAGVVFLSACSPREVEPEFQDEGKVYGLLTRFLVQTLNQEHAISQLSYDLLQKSIIQNYRRDPRVAAQFPTPQLEGKLNDRQSSILGYGKEVDRPAYFRVDTISGSRVRLGAGNLHGLTTGTLLEFYESAEQVAAANAVPQNSEQSDNLWLRVEQLQPMTSVAEVVRWVKPHGSQPAKLVSEELGAGVRNGFAVLRQLHSESAALRVRVVHAKEPLGDSRPLQSHELSQAMRGMFRSGSESDEMKWLRLSTDPQEGCDLVFRIDGDLGALFPATGVAEIPASTEDLAIPTALRGGWGPFDISTALDHSEPPRTLVDYCRQIAQARNLIALAASSTETPDLQASLEMLQLDVTWDGNDQEATIHSGTPRVPAEDGSLTIQVGDFYGFQVHNAAANRQAIYLTVLKVTPDMGIELVLPQDDAFLKLEPGESTSLTAAAYRLDAEERLGVSHAILLATREKHDFRFVVSRNLSRLRGLGGDSELNRRLAELTFFELPMSRGRRRPSSKGDSAWSVKSITWKAKP